MTRLGPTLAKDWPILVLLVLDVAFGFAVLGRMPARVPVHWGWKGTPDGWGPPAVNAILLPALAIGVYLLMLLLPLVDPRRENYPLFEDTLRFYRGLLVVFMIGLHFVVVLESLGRHLDIDVVLRMGLPLLFVGLGNRLGRVRPNWLVGIRVPWTLSSDEVWVRTHRLGARVMVVGGLLLLPAALLPPAPGLIIMMAGIVIITVIPIVYSYRLYKSLGARA